MIDGPIESWPRNHNNSPDKYQEPNIMEKCLWDIKERIEKILKKDLRYISGEIRKQLQPHITNIESSVTEIEKSLNPIDQKITEVRKQTTNLLDILNEDINPTNLPQDIA